jgi:galacturan 1,4-alpha-galacturonidase
MQFKTSIAALLLNALTGQATWLAYEEYLSLLPKHVSKHPGTRPSIDFHPHKPFKPFPTSPLRNRTCYAQSHNDFKTDDSQYILEAIEKCNNGGTVVFPLNTTYVIGTALNLTGLKHIDIGKSRIGNNGGEWQY